MAQDRTDFTPSSTAATRQGASAATPSMAERADAHAEETWRTTRAAGSNVVEQGQALGRRLMRDPLSAESMAVFVVGAAAGLALAYTLFRYAGSSTDRSGRADQTGSRLNTLIQISRDGERGFEACADGVTDEELKRVFREGAERCRAGALELERNVRMLGADPESGGTTSGAFHRAWVNVKSTVTGMDEAAVLNECERGEDVAKRVYGEVLRTAMPQSVRAIVERQYRGVVQNHDRIRALRDRRSKAGSGGA
jgi:uncharacterized protein (TIGR02284 family)